MIRGLSLLIALFQLACGLAGTAELPEIDFDRIGFLSSRTDSGHAQLVNGEYREQTGPGSATETVVKLTDAVAFGKQSGKETGAVANDAVVVDMTTHSPADPICCPTRQAVHQLVLRDNRLVKMGDEVIGRTNPMLIGSEWKWQQSIYSNDTKAVPPNPENYTLKLLSDGTVNIRADCNLGGGIYRLSGNGISIEITYTTIAACPPESLEQTYIRDLTAAAICFFEADILYIDLKHDAGTMKFTK